MNLQLINNNHQSNFYNFIHKQLSECNSFFFSVAFISDSAIQLIVDDLVKLESRGIKGRILTTDYMNGTSPKALAKLLMFKNIELRVFSTLDDKEKGFHTKGYFFEKDMYNVLSIGSSNLTSKAFKSNHEWNLTYTTNENSDIINRVKNEFELLWSDKNSISIDQNYLNRYTEIYNQDKSSTKLQNELFKRLADFLKDFPDSGLIDSIDEYFEVNSINNTDIVNALSNNRNIKPNKMQESALENLYSIRHNGGTKALIVSATGTGKTYLAAFDVLQMNPNRMLFIVHREKILKDAMKSFKNILDVECGLYTGNSKSLHSKYLFASIQTISKDEHLYNLNESAFDYIVIDEAHRSAAPTYQKVLQHFKPKFWLGMTATPERTDANSIFELFDNQVGIEIRLRDALKENLVVPFHYFGITDAVTDLSDINVLKDIDILAERLNIKARVDLIIENILKYGHTGNKTKALGFCVNIEHAKYMAEQFNLRGLRAVALTSESSEYERELCVDWLEDTNNPLSYIFTVDIFNEGIDIPSINLILMLRPTQSPIIFTQQLGRGLRLHPNKDYLTVLDFIGNHNKTFLISIALSGDRNYDKDDLLLETKNDFLNIPGDTFVRLDPISKQRILNQLERYNFDDLRNLKELYYDTKTRVNRIPMLLDYGFDSIDPVRFIEKKYSYLEFVDKVDGNSSLEKTISDINSLKIVRFIDSLLPIKRIYEYAIIREILINETNSKSDIFNALYNYIDNPDRDDFQHAINHINATMFSKTDLNRFNAIIYENEDTIHWTDEMNDALQDSIIKSYIIGSVQYGIDRYLHEFGRIQNAYPNFDLYKQYELREIPAIIRYKTIFVNQGGVLKFNNHYYLFVSLEKGDVKESINYKDKFIDKKTFQWESPNNTRELSTTGNNIINHKEKDIHIHLFVKKGGKNSKIYSKKMMYLGEMDVITHENEKPIQFKFNMHNELSDDVYFKLTMEFNENEENN